MKNYNWKIEMPEIPTNIRAAIVATLEEINDLPDNSTRIRRIKGKFLLPLVAILCLAIGGTVVAGVNLYQQRMEAMNRDMLEDFYTKAYAGSVFHYSRELSDAERRSYEALVKAYENEGRFPQGIVRYLEDYKDYNGEGIGLYADRSTLFLPDYEMSEEEVLQIIDFEHKLSYSVNTIGAEIVEGEYHFSNDYDQLAPETDGNDIIAYEGTVGIICATEGKECLYIAGDNIIERMTFGANKGKPFYKANFGENTEVFTMEEDMEQGLYVLILTKGRDNYAESKILHIDKNGKLIYEKEIKEYIASDIAVDSIGRLYVETDTEVYVYDKNGEQVCAWQIKYSLQNGSMCRGKDGKVYTLCEDKPFQACLLRLDPDAEEQVTMVASDGLPTGTPHCAVLARGMETDFVIWRYDGVYAYNLGDNFVYKVMELYEAPLPWEEAEFMVLEDGRLVFIKYFDALVEEGEGMKIMPIPQSIRMCYVSCPKVSLKDKVVFGRSSEAASKEELKE